jgi:hypothetical protein
MRNGSATKVATPSVTSAEVRTGLSGNGCKRYGGVATPPQSGRRPVSARTSLPRVSRQARRQTAEAEPAIRPCGSKAARARSGNRHAPRLGDETWVSRRSRAIFMAYFTNLLRISNTAAANAPAVKTSK